VLRRTSMRTDSKLVEAARGGDVASLGELYRRHYTVTMGVARSVLGDWHAAEDAVQESFAIACRDQTVFAAKTPNFGILREGKRGQVQFAGTARRVLRTNLDLSPFSRATSSRKVGANNHKNRLVPGSLRVSGR